MVGSFALYVDVFYLSVNQFGTIFELKEMIQVNQERIALQTAAMAKQRQYEFYSLVFKVWMCFSLLSVVFVLAWAPFNPSTAYQAARLLIAVLFLFASLLHIYTSCMIVSLMREPLFREESQSCVYFMTQLLLNLCVVSESVLLFVYDSLLRHHDEGTFNALMANNWTEVCCESCLICLVCWQHFITFRGA